MTVGNKIYEGMVRRWVDRGPSAGFGFIQYSPGGSSNDEVFYLWEDIEVDNIGRKHHGRIVGNLVRFKLIKTIHRGQPSARAVEVQSVFPTDIEEGDLAGHREISTVERLIDRAAFLKRESGDQCFLSVNDVDPMHRHKFSKLRTNDHVWHGIRPPAEDGRLFSATFAEFYSEQEEKDFAKEN
jgi:hypothetical protein